MATHLWDLKSCKKSRKDQLKLAYQIANPNECMKKSVVLAKSFAVFVVEDIIQRGPYLWWRDTEDKKEAIHTYILSLWYRVRLDTLKRYEKHIGTYDRLTK